MNFSRSASGLKKVLSSPSGQEDFPARQVHVAFHSCLPNGQGPRQVVYQLNAKRSKLGQEKLMAAGPKGKLAFIFFFLSLDYVAHADLEELNSLAMQEIFMP